ncbi:MAG: 2-phospho-L-lactate guanylyltransferase [SAR202 cluster bacterium Ae2-Chloro-G1]|nr:MAG: 2-phospho-L-lactate guanylyltransferase [SAR202 cluster bacterium Ae2-Chloro-G1]
MLPVTILIPVKDPCQSKTRLSGLLSSSERSTLAANMLMRVIQAAVRSEVDDIVVAGSQLNSLKQLIEVQEFGSVRWVDVLGQDLNVDVEIASAGIKNSGRAYIYIPSDVPFVTSNDIEDVIRSSEDGGIFVFVPSESDGGTNAMLIPQSSTFSPLLGVDSFRRHCEYAECNGLDYRIVRPSGLTLDLDTEKDLAHCEEIEPGFTDRLAAFPVDRLE